MITRLTLLSLPLLSSLCFGQGASSESYRTQPVSVDAGGGAAASATYSIKASRFGGFMGTASSVNYESKAGYLAQLLSQFLINLCDFDSWASQYFTAGQANSSRDDDADGDGTTNMREFLALTDPTDPASRFRVWIAPSNSGYDINFSPRAARELRTYSLFLGDDLASPLNFRTSVSEVNAEGGFFHFSSLLTDKRQFFKVGIIKAR